MKRIFLSLAAWALVLAPCVRAQTTDEIARTAAYIAAFKQTFGYTPGAMADSTSFSELP